MLKELRVKNVALIHEAALTLGEGLNILTGETGAGKSILIDSIQLALGARADRSLIRQGADSAYVELSFLPDERCAKKLKELDIDTEDGWIILSRKLDQSKNVCRINGEIVSSRILRQAADLLIDIHGQQEHTQLLNEKKHLEIVDLFCGEKELQLIGDIKNAYDDYTDCKKAFEEAGKNEGQKERQIDQCRYELSEIDGAALRPGEDEELENEYSRLSNRSRIAEAVMNAKELLDSAEGECALSMIGTALGALKDAARFDDGFKADVDSLLELEDGLREEARVLTRYMDNMTTDEGRLSEISDRLDVINRLKLKYGQSIEKVLAYGEGVREKLEQLENFGEYLKALEEKLSASEEKLKKLCKKAHENRVRSGKALAGEIKEALLFLGFEHVEFETKVKEDVSSPGPDGYDHVSFEISLNAGQKLRPLSQVASGGELSRIMLAIKSVMADTDDIGTLIFDEIDAGISGQAAWRVSERMAVIGRSHQLICITHLPQIAAMADTHFCIRKDQGKNDTVTVIETLDGEGSVDEIARLLGSDSVTESALENARELKKKADETKGR